MGWLLSGNQGGGGAFMALCGPFCISGIDNSEKPFLISRGARLPFALVRMGVFGGVLDFGFVGLSLGPGILAIEFTLIFDCAVARAVDPSPGADRPLVLSDSPPASAGPAVTMGSR